MMFNSKKSATHEIKRMKQSGNQKSRYLGSRSRVYQCPACLNYHLTTMSAVEIRRSKYIQEQRRRLRIFKQIQDGGIEILLRLNESWMLLIMKESEWILECKISGASHYVIYYK